ncbi:MAG: TetR/AcrR family transcriptional regulator [Silicimonas sp.]|nr:TetR/AcrR family transcriptional regulator [Silicimonas sp.]
MNEREKSIARAAMRAYQAKGVSRATMSDIAAEAGVSRQTVYNTFPGSDAMLRGAVRSYIEDLWAEVQKGWRRCEALGDKLDVLLVHFALEPWEFLNASDVAAELERGHNPVGRAEIEASRDMFRHEIADLFRPWEQALAARGTDPLAVSDYISAAIEGIKYNNKTRADMTRAVATLKAGLMALTGAPPEAG